jgi:hypothetical protein
MLKALVKEHIYIAIQVFGVLSLFCITLFSWFSSQCWIQWCVTILRSETLLGRFLQNGSVKDPIFAINELIHLHFKRQAGNSLVDLESKVFRLASKLAS